MGKRETRGYGAAAQRQDAGRNWLVCLGWRHALTSQVRCQIVFSRHLSQQPAPVGRWAHGAGHPRGRATRAPGARRRGCAVQGPRLAVPERPEDGRQLLPKLEAPPRGQQQPPRALPGPVPGAHARPLRESAPQRPDIRTRDPALQERSGDERPPSSLRVGTQSLQRRMRKGCRFGPNLCGWRS